MHIRRNIASLQLWYHTNHGAGAADGVANAAGVVFVAATHAVEHHVQPQWLQNAHVLSRDYRESEGEKQKKKNKRRRRKQ